MSGGNSAGGTKANAQSTFGSGGAGGMFGVAPGPNMFSIGQAAQSPWSTLSGLNSVVGGGQSQQQPQQQSMFGGYGSSYAPPQPTRQDVWNATSPMDQGAYLQSMMRTGQPMYAQAPQRPMQQQPQQQMQMQAPSIQAPTGNAGVNQFMGPDAGNPNAVHDYTTVQSNPAQHSVSSFMGATPQAWQMQGGMAKGGIADLLPMRSRK